MAIININSFGQDSTSLTTCDSTVLYEFQQFTKIHTLKINTDKASCLTVTCLNDHTLGVYIKLDKDQKREKRKLLKEWDYNNPNKQSRRPFKNFHKIISVDGTETESGVINLSELESGKYKLILSCNTNNLDPSDIKLKNHIATLIIEE
ncbi:MAG: hypothetical protein HRT90_08440 [Candidatus Margulisbacteria bacterium]|nr:hypothetical protein [Candidatus Margulisiibacteriota bacterium]